LNALENILQRCGARHLQQTTGLRRDARRAQAYRHHQNARALELFPAAESFRAYLTGIKAPFGTLKFGHVEI
jgi:hypothetical protein